MSERPGREALRDTTALFGKASNPGICVYSIHPVLPAPWPVNKEPIPSRAVVDWNAGLETRKGERREAGPGDLDSRSTRKGRAPGLKAAWCERRVAAVLVSLSDLLFLSRGGCNASELRPIFCRALATLQLLSRLFWPSSSLPLTSGTRCSSV